MSLFPKSFLLSDHCSSAVPVQDYSLAEFLRDQSSQVSATSDPQGFKKQEAIWELFTSECVYFLDQLMVLKEVTVRTNAHAHAHANTHRTHSTADKKTKPKRNPTPAAFPPVTEFLSVSFM